MLANPRVIDNEVQGVLVLPFNIENAETTHSLNETYIDSPVALTANNEISEGADGEAFLGKLLNISDDGQLGFVQIKGICTDLSYSGTAPVIGWSVQMSGNGTVEKGITDRRARGYTLSVNMPTATCDILL